MIECDWNFIIVDQIDLFKNGGYVITNDFDAIVGSMGGFTR